MTVQSFGLLGFVAVCRFTARGWIYDIYIDPTHHFTYAELIDKTTYLNHYYWVGLASLLMTFLPLHRTASLDAWRKPSLRSKTIPRWVI